MIVLCILITVVVVGLSILRITWVNIIASDWNEKLTTYYENFADRGYIKHNEYKDMIVNPRRYYLLLNVWNVRHIFSNHELISEIERYKYQESSI